MHSKAGIALQEMGRRTNVTVEISTSMKLLLVSVGKAGIPATVLHEFSPTKRTFVVEFGLIGSFSVWGFGGDFSENSILIVISYSVFWEII